MKGREIMDEIHKAISESHNADAVKLYTEVGHSELLELHARALACHCECLGMNAENSWAVCNNSQPPYSQAHYTEVLQKWGIVNGKGEPLI